jgi:hypothetical protein
MNQQLSALAQQQMATVKPASAKPPADPSNPAETTQPRTP